jgi:hypothetical protein
MVHIYAGGDAWTNGPGGLGEASPADRERFRASASRDIIVLLLRAERGEIAARAIEGARVDDRTPQILELAAGTPDAVQLHLDPQTALVLKQTYTVQGPNGPADAEELYSDYRDVDGIQVAFKAVVRQAGRTLLERAVTRFAINVQLDDTLFKKPL